MFGSLTQDYFQPGDSDVNLLIVVADGTNIHALRQMFLPIWEAHGAILKRAPMIAAYSAFVRHMQLNPLLCHHLLRDGEQLFGAPDLIESILPPLDPNEAYAWLTSEVMRASNALAPALLAEETAVAAPAQLRRLVRQMRREPVPLHEPAKRLFARAHHFLTPIVSRLPDVRQWAGAKASPATSPILPGLQTIYKEAGKMVLVFAQLTPEQIIRTDWARLSDHIGKHTVGIEVTSTTHLCLIATHERPLDVQFKKFEHNWGPDFLPTLNLPRHQIFRQAARLPSSIEVDALPNALMIQDDDALHEIIHDFQNKLLNVQLEHELMCRFELVERFTPPEPLPSRETPSKQRVIAIFQHLAWWADFYTEQMQQHTP